MVRVRLLLWLLLQHCSFIVFQCRGGEVNANTETEEQDSACVSITDETTTCLDSQSSSSVDDQRFLQLLSELHTRQFYINGTWIDPISHDLFDVIDPSTSQILTQISLGDEADTHNAVQSATSALKSWHLQTSPSRRRSYINRIISNYQSRLHDIGLLISREMGAPIDMAIDSQAGSFMFHAEEFMEVFEGFEFERVLPQLEREGVVLGDGGAETTILIDPVGVVAMITPWNWPMNQIALKVIPALLVGCTVILKPSELSPLSALLFAQTVHEAGLPPGVFNLINGAGPVVGQQLASHPDVDMVSFTGSTRAGSQVSKAAADTFKKVSLELGGKGAYIIFEDVYNLEEVVTNGVESVFENSGQSCNAPTRMFVHQSLYEQAVSIAKDVAMSTRVDSAHKHFDDEEHHIGPVVSLAQFKRIQHFIQLGIEEGATLLVGGLGKPSPHQDSMGYYVKPTIFIDCKPEMTIFQQEIFGPVLCITTFTNDDEAIELANASPYGLTHYVHSSNLPRRRRMARELRAGMVEMNGAGWDMGSPFGGMKSSGIGREGGVYGLEEFCEVKAVTGYFDKYHDEEYEYDDD